MEVKVKITYANKRVEKYFSDFSKMQKKLPEEWVKKIKIYLKRLQASRNFGEFLDLYLGHPERLSGYDSLRYSLRVSANARLIFEVSDELDEVRICQEIEIEGVCDYHGNKETWYIP